MMLKKVNYEKEQYENGKNQQKGKLLTFVYGNFNKQNKNEIKCNIQYKKPLCASLIFNPVNNKTNK